MFLLQQIEIEEKVLSGTIGIFCEISAMIAFILFIQSVLKDIKVENVVDNIYKKSLFLVQK